MHHGTLNNKHTEGYYLEKVCQVAPQKLFQSFVEFKSNKLCPARCGRFFGGFGGGDASTPGLVRLVHAGTVVIYMSER